MFWNFAFNIIVNGFLAFLTICLLVGLVLTFFRVKQARLKALFLTIPFLKLVIDPFLYDFSTWALNNSLNPLEAAEGTRTMTVAVGFVDGLPIGAIIKFFINNFYGFTVADLLLLLLPPLAVKGVVLSVGSISLILVGRFLYTWFKAKEKLAQIIKRATPCKRKVKNEKLLKRLKRPLMISKEVGAPFESNIICFPTDLVDKLSQEEFEAIIAHELDHLEWKDGLSRSICQLIGAFFWWIPLKWLYNRLHAVQESACDASIAKYNLLNIDLASSLLKVAKELKRAPLYATHFLEEGSIASRISSLVGEAPKSHLRILWLQRVIVSSIAIVLLVGRFWIF